MLKDILQFWGRAVEAREGNSESPRAYLLSKTQILAQRDTTCNTDKRSP